MQLKAKFVMFVLLPTLQDFLTEMALQGLEEIKLEDFQAYLKEKTGFNIEIAWLDKFLNSFINNTDTFMTVMTMQLMDQVADGLVDGSFFDNLISNFKSFFNGLKGS